MSDRAAEQQGRQYILSLRPQWMEKILRGEKLGAVCPPMSWRTVKRGCEIWL